MYRINDAKGREIFATSSAATLIGYLAECSPVRMAAPITMDLDGRRAHIANLPPLPERCRLTDAELMACIATPLVDGEAEDALTVLQHRYSGKLVAVVAKRLNGDYVQAERIVAETWRVIVERAAEFNGPFLKWLTFANAATFERLAA